MIVVTATLDILSWFSLGRIKLFFFPHMSPDFPLHFGGNKKDEKNTGPGTDEVLDVRGAKAKRRHELNGEAEITPK